MVGAMRMPRPSSSAAAATADVAQSDVRAIALACLAGVFFVALNATVKHLTGTIDTVMLIWARYFFHVMVVVVLFPRTLKAVVRVPQQGVQLGRSLLLLGSTVMNFTALIFMPLGDVSAIIFTSPLLVAGIAMLWLKERVTALRWVIIGAGFLGSLMIVRPGGGDFNVGALLAMGCALSYAFYQVSTRIVREAEPMVSLLYGGIVGMLAFSLVVPFFWRWPSPLEWALLAMIGILGAVGHLMMIMALQRAEVSKVSPFTYLQLIWAMLVSAFLLGDVPDGWTIVGAAVIVLSGLALMTPGLGRPRLPGPR